MPAPYICIVPLYLIGYLVYMIAATLELSTSVWPLHLIKLQDQGNSLSISEHQMYTPWVQTHKNTLSHSFLCLLVKQNCHCQKNARYSLSNVVNLMLGLWWPGNAGLIVSRVVFHHVSGLIYHIPLALPLTVVCNDSTALQINSTT